jgi:ubiquinone/menaquinone biosynthesis C-methylase UbiE
MKSRKRSRKYTQGYDSIFEDGYWMEKRMANAVGLWLKHEGATFHNCLDIACGYRSFGTVGIDVSKSALRNLKKSKVLAEASNLPFKGEVFNETICNFLLEHLLPSQALQVACECRRVLKKSGRCYFVTEKLHRNFYGDYTHIHPFSVSGLKQLMDDAGFSDTLAKKSFPLVKGYNYIGRKFGEDLLFKIQKITRPLLWIKINNLIGVGVKR